jgi:hypothetical protein
MSICVTHNFLDVHSVYPVVDPRRTAGDGPYAFAYVFAWDDVEITVEHTSTLTSCQMIVNFFSPLREAKEIQAWNLFNNNFVDRIGSSSLGLQASMTIQKGGAPGLSCGTGADTVVLCRYFAWPRGRTALYSFAPQDFWDFWGGCKVTFRWVSDTEGSGLWGDETPDPVYPMVKFPDRTLMRDSAGTGFVVVFGGAGFNADLAFLTTNFFDPAAARPFSSDLPSTPVDGTLVREVNRPQVFIVFGGAKFWIPDPLTLFTLGYDFNQVRVIPSGGTAQLRTMPLDGTLLKEQHDPKVFLVNNRQLRWITSPAAMDSRCLPWRHIRTVPDNALAALVHGPDLDP